MNKTEIKKITNRVNELRIANWQIIDEMNGISKDYNIIFDDGLRFPRTHLIIEECLPLLIDGKMNIMDYTLLCQCTSVYMQNIHVICELNTLKK